MPCHPLHLFAQAQEDPGCQQPETWGLEVPTYEGEPAAEGASAGAGWEGGRSPGDHGQSGTIFGSCPRFLKKLELYGPVTGYGHYGTMASNYWHAWPRTTLRSGIEARQLKDRKTAWQCTDVQKLWCSGLHCVQRCWMLIHVLIATYMHMNTYTHIYICIYVYIYIYIYLYI